METLLSKEDLIGVLGYIIPSSGVNPTPDNGGGVNLPAVTESRQAPLSVAISKPVSNNSDTTDEPKRKNTATLVFVLTLILTVVFLYFQTKRG